jgi:hypothetical protein
MKFYTNDLYTARLYIPEEYEIITGLNDFKLLDNLKIGLIGGNKLPNVNDETERLVDLSK